MEAGKLNYCCAISRGAICNNYATEYHNVLKSQTPFSYLIKNQNVIFYRGNNILLFHDILTG
jgi:hypothetical protein